MKWILNWNASNWWWLSWDWMHGLLPWMMCSLSTMASINYELRGARCLSIWSRSYVWRMEFEWNFFPPLYKSTVRYVCRLHCINYVYRCIWMSERQIHWAVCVCMFRVVVSWCIKMSSECLAHRHIDWFSVISHEMGAMYPVLMDVIKMASTFAHISKPFARAHSGRIFRFKCRRKKLRCDWMPRNGKKSDWIKRTWWAYRSFLFVFFLFFFCISISMTHL